MHLGYAQLARHVVDCLKFWLVCIGWCSCTRWAFAESMFSSDGLLMSAADLLLMGGYSLLTSHPIGALSVS
jgi:hypothetical protein